MSSSAAGSTATLRAQALRKLLQTGQASTQDELAVELKRQKFRVTQSTISRDLTRLGAIKTRETDGRVVYRLPENAFAQNSPSPANHLDLVLDVRHNESMIVIVTSPGSAPLLARFLDQTRFSEILGTVAGDDTVFVAPKASRQIGELVKKIRQEFLP